MILPSLFTILCSLCMFFVSYKEAYAAEKKVICLVPQFDFYSRGEPLFTLDSTSGQWTVRKSYIALRDALESSGYTIELATSSHGVRGADYYIFFDLPDTTPNQKKQALQFFIDNGLLDCPKERRILFIWEPVHIIQNNYDPELHEFFGKIFTCYDPLVDNKKYFKMCYPQPCLHMQQNPIEFEQRKLCTLIAGNKQFDHVHELYSERRRIIDFFENLGADDFEFYGPNWKIWNRIFKNYKGTIPLTQVNKNDFERLTIGHQSKIDCLKKYRFAFCYENIADSPGYITEKIFDCFIAGCVPVYWGANNITEYIPEDCFIDRRRFANTYEVYEFLKGITKEEYDTYLQNINKFLASEKASLFSTDTFIQTVMFALEVSNDEANEEVRPITVAIFAKDKAHTLPVFLKCLEHQTWPQSRTYLYIRTFNNKDNTAEILNEWLAKNGSRYLGVHFDDADLEDHFAQLYENNWNKSSFIIDGTMKQDSLDWAFRRGSHYFLLGCNNFILPPTLATLANTNLPIVAPLLRTANTLYSNFQVDIDKDGYYIGSSLYEKLLASDIKGLIEVPVVNSTYFIRHDVLNKMRYIDKSGHPDYVIFSTAARKLCIPQYLDTRQMYGRITRAETFGDFASEPWLKEFQ